MATIFPVISLWGFFQGQLTPQSVVGSGQISHACHHYLQVGSDKKQPRKSGNTVFSSTARSAKELL